MKRMSWHYPGDVWVKDTHVVVRACIRPRGKKEFGIKTSKQTNTRMPGVLLQWEREL